MLELITNKIFFDSLLYYSLFTMILHCIISFFTTLKKPKKHTAIPRSTTAIIEADNSIVSKYTIFFKIIFILIITLSILSIPAIKNIFNILSVIYYISILFACFIYICFTSIFIKLDKFDNFEVNTYLSFTPLLLGTVKISNTSYIFELISNFQNTYTQFFEYFFIITLLIEFFFFIFMGLFNTFIILRDFKKIINTKTPIHLFLHKFRHWITSKDEFNYDFYFYKKYYHKVFCRLFLYLIDLTILFIVTVLTYLLLLIKLPIYLLLFLLEIFIIILSKVVNTEPAYFVFKWFRIVLIISTLCTYIIIKISNTTVSEIALNIFELLSTVILIPLIMDQLSDLKHKNKN